MKPESAFSFGKHPIGILQLFSKQPQGRRGIYSENYWMDIGRGEKPYFALTDMKNGTQLFFDPENRLKFGHASKRIIGSEFKVLEMDEKHPKIKNATIILASKKDILAAREVVKGLFESIENDNIGRGMAGRITNRWKKKLPVFFNKTRLGALRKKIEASINECEIGMKIRRKPKPQF
ncbi:hypothetical protein HY989_00350 [Candidatus Micrarchaeota archaeon]|nr:hypothetical protein [Candidatus Micrarchaeota archaeon]